MQPAHTDIATVTTSVATPRDLTPTNWAALTAAMRSDLNTKLEAMAWLAERQCWGMEVHYKTLAQSNGIGLSSHSWKRLHTAWKAGGERALVNHQLCGGKCGLSECGNKNNASMLAQATVNEWVRIATDNRVSSGTSTGRTRTFEDAWRKLISALCAGEPIPGLAGEAMDGTWHDLWRRARPTKATPAVCPWSTVPGNTPPGHSLQNFVLRKPNKALVVTAQQGIGKGRELLAEVNLDVSKLRPLEALVFDDKRFDLLIQVTVNGKPQLAECWALLCMDIATRRIVGAQLIPKIKRDDGTSRGITRRDMQHLAAQVLRTFGYPTSFVSTWIVENAAAAITDDVEALLTRVTNGQVRVRRSGTFADKLRLGGFTERGGNPRGKSWLESYNARIDIALGDIIGQIGGDYSRKPGDADGRQAHAALVNRSMGTLATIDQLAALTPYNTAETALPLILQAMHRLDNNPLHDLQGFDSVALWRYGASDTEWRSMGDDAMRSLVATMGHQHVNEHILGKSECVQIRNETPCERWEKLWLASNYATLNRDAFVDLYMDAASACYTTPGVLRAAFKTLSGKAMELEFRGHHHSLIDNQNCLVRCDLDNPSIGAWLQDAQGRYMGRMDYRERIAFGDETALKHRLGESMAARADALADARKIKQPRGQVIGEIARIDAETTLIRSIIAPHVNEAAAPLGSAQLAYAIAAAETAPTPRIDGQAEQRKSLAAAHAARQREADAEPAALDEIDTLSPTDNEPEPIAMLADW